MTPAQRDRRRLPPVQEDPIRFAWVARLIGRLMALYVRLVAATARTSGPRVAQMQMIWAVWHESNLAVAVAALALRDDPAAIVFTTRGFRGIVMNAMLRGIGCGAVTLPPEGSAGRAEAASVSRTMARLTREGWSVLASCDGPFGPPRVAKPGVLIVARESGLPVQPWAIAVRPPLRLKRRWDRQLVPLPFCRIRVVEGKQLRLGPRERIRPRLQELQAELDRITALADRRMASRLHHR
ncbi:MAG TPA: hypothetical protein VFH63_09295 [candidate division Zixibacteria bacterium]|nr:hypothetical protein [candidate division Zixibacteria bacterium]